MQLQQTETFKYTLFRYLDWTIAALGRLIVPTRRRNRCSCLCVWTKRPFALLAYGDQLVVLVAYKRLSRGGWTLMFQTSIGGSSKRRRVLGRCRTANYLILRWGKCWWWRLCVGSKDFIVFVWWGKVWQWLWYARLFLPLTRSGKGNLGGVGVHSARMPYRENSWKLCGKAGWRCFIMWWTGNATDDFRGVSQGLGEWG